MSNYNQKHNSKNPRKKTILSVSIFVVLLVGLGFFFVNNHTKKATVQASKNNIASENSKAVSQESTKNDKTVKNNENTNQVLTTNQENTDGKNNQTPKPTGDKAVYLTFDDGPSTKVTPQILKILEEYNVKASFFLVGKSVTMYPNLVKEEKAKGHAVCNHTYSHNYKYLYSNPNTFIKDAQKCDDAIKSVLGQETNKIIRFPGGGFYKKRAPYRELAKNKGFKAIDWTVETGDARTNNVPVDKLLSNLKTEMGSCPKSKKNNVIVLMHDISTKQTTADALPQVIQYFKSQGYTFKTLEDYPSK
ncbi:polysaccharide deacetylase family protein [Clostridium sp. MB40-C1]|uniref:polysaccharide deacetylase family protein n=1 Tax=Clostridium sp. MB40-C1 TaxID=3070996 RepID=UPI0027E06747|nr:polysaccharide deacetylase family protein [Clostridium sp. MB40-C1]WMJ79795.1 polysaccharide deacetylase family protein [Clostridium sp. MB40-C1]